MSTTLPPKERLLRAAELFYQEGINTVGVNRLIDEAGVAQMSLWRLFGSKDGLVEAFLRRRDERIRAKFEREVERRATSGREKVLAMFDVLEEVLADRKYRGCAFINASVELPAPSHPARAVSLAHKDAAHAMFARYAGEAGVPDPDRLATRLLLLMDGAFVSATMRGDPSIAGEAKQAAEVLLDTAMGQGRGGSGVRPASSPTQRSPRR